MAGPGQTAVFESVPNAHYVGPDYQAESDILTVIVILALVAVFIGLRLYSVLGERTGHEQPILKPADPEARVEARPTPQTPPAQQSTDPADLA